MLVDGIKVKALEVIINYPFYHIYLSTEFPGTPRHTPQQWEFKYGAISLRTILVPGIPVQGSGKDTLLRLVEDRFSTFLPFMTRPSHPPATPTT